MFWALLYSTQATVADVNARCNVRKRQRPMIPVTSGDLSSSNENGYRRGVYYFLLFYFLLSSVKLPLAKKNE